MYPCRYILLGDIDILLNSNFSEVYALTKYLHELGYNGLISKGS